MQNRDLNSLPPFPSAPCGVPRWGHLPTIEASLRYWQSESFGTARDVTAERATEGLPKESRRAIAIQAFFG
jgi:hypothetical protein